MRKRKTPLAAAVVIAGMALLGGCGTTSDPELAAPSTPPAEATSANGAEAVVTLLEGMNAVVEIADVLSRADYFSSSIECLNGGSVNLYDRTVTLDAEADLKAQFVECREGDVTLNGTLHVVAKLSGDEFTAAVIDTVFLRESIYADDVEIAVISNIHAKFSGSSGTTTSSMQWSRSGETHQYNNLRVAFEINEAASEKTQCLREGRIYIDNLNASMEINAGYDPYCTDPFTVQSGVLVSGSAELNASDGTVDIEVTGSNEITVTGSAAPDMPAVITLQ